MKLFKFTELQLCLNLQQSSINMRIFSTVLCALITAALCYLLNTIAVLPVPLGKLLSPQGGIWQNAVPRNFDFSMELPAKGLKGEVEIFLDERLVPHVYADNDEDLFFAQGFLHARFRLWQMDLQTMAAAGRASELVGKKALDHDREFRRLGMVYAAENALNEINNDPYSKSICDAYTAGVNAYISSLSQSTLPLEYKLMGYYPENWSNFKTALFLKYMSYDLAAHEQDFEKTNTRAFFGAEKFHLLFPDTISPVDPIIPDKWTAPAELNIIPRVNYDTIAFDRVQTITSDKPDRDNGSNNWVISGHRTQDGAPILANDPHLGLNLPSLWFEMHLQSPSFNVYGVSFPGAPSIPIGFNNNIAWGVTNGGRDVRDYFEVTFNDDSRTQYLFDGKWEQTHFRIEEIKIKGGSSVYDTVAYTNLGPVMYENRFGGKASIGKSFAVRWTAHDPSNELLCFINLNKANNYKDYLQALSYMKAPGQNFAFASKTGDIAMRTQGQWPAKWNHQGDFIMPGEDSTFLWQGYIPDSETPMQYNPQRGFVSSANQPPADISYPYYLGTDYPTSRGLIINRMLAADSTFTIEKVKKMQTNNYNVFAEGAMPILMSNISKEALGENAQHYFKILGEWDLYNNNESVGATVFELAWNELYNAVYDDDYANAPKLAAKPAYTTLLQFLVKDSAYVFIDDINTPEIESLSVLATRSFKKAAEEMKRVEQNGRLPWGKYKDTHIMHLTKLEPFSRLHLPIGGGKYEINATKENHGPSWRMIVQMSSNIKAFGVYPGGQDGNPGSRFYDNFINTWVEGEYFPLELVEKTSFKKKKTVGKIILKPV